MQTYSTIISADLDIQVKQADTAVLELTFSEDDQPFPITGQVVFKVKQHKVSKKIAIQKSDGLGLEVQDSTILIQLDAEDTSIPANTYFYDIQNITDIIETKTICEGAFIINQNV